MTALTYQLYSSRNFPPLGDTLRMLAEIGYASVEGYGALLSDAEALNALEQGLKDTGLTMPSCHVSLDLCETDPNQVAGLAKRFGIQTIVIPYIMPDDRPTDAAGWSAYGARLQAVADALSASGREVAYHNHDFEFVALADGTLPMDLILSSAPDVKFEYDVAWALRAGVDPMDAIKRYGSRITIAHLKDIAPEGQAQDEDGWADVGHGTMDWATLFDALKAAGTQHFAAEHDNPSDERRFATRSFNTVQSF